MAEIDVAGMSDEQLLALANEAVDEAPNLEGEQADAAVDAGEAANEADATTQAEQAQQEGEQHGDDWKPDGPGDLKTALRQARESEKAAKAEAARIAAEAAELRQWRQQQEAERRQAQYLADERARLEQRNAMLDDVFDPQERAQLLERFAREDAYIASQTAQQQVVAARYEDGFALAREAFSDFDTVFNKAMADPQQSPLLEAVAAQALQQGKNPVFAAYQMAKKLDPDAQKALIQAEVQRQVKEVLQKQKPPDTQGHKGISHVTSGIPAGDKPLPVSKRSTEDLMREAGFIR